MLAQVGVVLGGLGAIQAPVRLFICVRLKVVRKVRASSEHLRTDCALAGFFTGVLCLVNCQVMVEAEHCSTVRTLERSSLCVHPLVSREGTPVGKGLRAGLALKPLKRLASEVRQVSNQFTRVGGGEDAEAAPKLVLSGDHWACGVPLGRLSVGMFGGHDEPNG